MRGKPFGPVVWAGSTRRLLNAPQPRRIACADSRTNAGPR